MLEIVVLYNIHQLVACLKLVRSSGSSAIRSCLLAILFPRHRKAWCTAGSTTYPASWSPCFTFRFLHWQALNSRSVLDFPRSATTQAKKSENEWSSKVASSYARHATFVEERPSPHKKLEGRSCWGYLLSAKSLDFPWNMAGSHPNLSLQPFVWLLPTAPPVWSQIWELYQSRKPYLSNSRKAFLSKKWCRIFSVRITSGICKPLGWVLPNVTIHVPVAVFYSHGPWYCHRSCEWPIVWPGYLIEKNRSKSDPASDPCGTPQCP